MSWFARLTNHRFLRFLIAGGLAALVNFGSRIAFSQFMAYVPAIVCAYLLGMITAFLLNRAFVFSEAAQADPRRQFVWFALVNVAAVLQTIAVSLLLKHLLLPLLDRMDQIETIAHAAGVIFPVFTSYVGHKRLTFRNPTA